MHFFWKLISLPVRLLDTPEYLKHCGDQRKKIYTFLYVSKYALKQQQMT